MTNKIIINQDVVEILKEMLQNTLIDYHIVHKAKKIQGGKLNFQIKMQDHLIAHIEQAAREVFCSPLEDLINQKKVFKIPDPIEKLSSKGVIRYSKSFPVVIIPLQESGMLFSYRINDSEIPEGHCVIGSFFAMKSDQCQIRFFPKSFKIFINNSEAEYTIKKNKIVRVDSLWKN